LPSTPAIFCSRWLLALVLSGLCAACAPEQPEYRQESFVFGTRVEITVHGTDKTQARQAVAAVLQRFDQLHRKLHAWQPSALDTLNTAFARGTDRIAVDPEMARILNDAQAFSRQSDGLFEPAIGNLIKLWGFHSDTPPTSLPDMSEVDRQVAARPSMQDVHFEDGHVWSSNPAVRIDLGGYAKGYALDEAAGILKKMGIRNALVNIGGNVIALGQHGSRAWKVGIQHPRKAGVMATLDLLDGEAIGTSGDYQRYFEAAGRRYCHLIDPRSGRPARGMQSVTVLVSGDSAGVKSDVLSKPLFVGGDTAMTHWLTQLNLAQAMAVDSKGDVLVTDAMLKRLQWREPAQTFQRLRLPPVR
jgi:FAD:protein FMN transferase